MLISIFLLNKVAFCYIILLEGRSVDMTKKLKNIVVTTLSTLGCLCIMSGIAMPKLIKFENNSVVKLEVTKKQVTHTKSNEIKLQDLKLEVGKTLSTDAHDYLKNPTDIDESIINKLKLDTSSINTNEIGNYIYTITYNKKIYNGSIYILPKALPNIDTITLNSLSFETGSSLPTNVSNYIKEKLPPEVLSAIRLDISNVDPSTPGNYLYSISYNKQLYTNTITIFEPKLTKDSTEILEKNEKK